MMPGKSRKNVVDSQLRMRTKETADISGAAPHPLREKRSSEVAFRIAVGKVYSATGGKKSNRKVEIDSSESAFRDHRCRVCAGSEKNNENPGTENELTVGDRRNVLRKKKNLKDTAPVNVDLTHKDNGRVIVIGGHEMVSTKAQKKRGGLGGKSKMEETGEVCKVKK